MGGMSIAVNLDQAVEFQFQVRPRASRGRNIYCPDDVSIGDDGRRRGSRS